MPSPKGWEATPLNIDQTTPNPFFPYTVIPESFRPRTVVRFGDASDLLVSGLLSGAGNIAERAAVVDARFGKGHTLLFAINPIWRGETIGSYGLQVQCDPQLRPADAGPLTRGSVETSASDRGREGRARGSSRQNRRRHRRGDDAVIFSSINRAGAGLLRLDRERNQRETDEERQRRQRDRCADRAHVDDQRGETIVDARADDAADRRRRTRTRSRARSCRTAPGSHRPNTALPPKKPSTNSVAMNVTRVRSLR